MTTACSSRLPVSRGTTGSSWWRCRIGRRPSGDSDVLGAAVRDQSGSGVVGTANMTDTRLPSPVSLKLARSKRTATTRVKLPRSCHRAAGSPLTLEPSPAHGAAPSLRGRNSRLPSAVADKRRLLRIPPRPRRQLGRSVGVPTVHGRRRDREPATSGHGSLERSATTTNSVAMKYLRGMARLRRRHGDGVSLSPAADALP